MQALIFDCDGVLAETERDGHRVAFNRAFATLGLGVEWSVGRYQELLKTAGGKERMRRSFDETRWPEAAKGRDRLIADLHQLKTEFFTQIVERGLLPLRTGVARLVGEALAEGVKVAVCSTASELVVQAIVNQLGPERAPRIAIFAGDVVSAKKPDPAIYLYAARSLEVAPGDCVVIEDNNNGLQAALAAGMTCIVTTAFYTRSEDFTGAAKVVPELGDFPRVFVTLEDCRALCGGAD
jgi:HAD superfamily hydrolase (TIGR01509 family)